MPRGHEASGTQRAREARDQAGDVVEPTRLVRGVDQCGGDRFGLGLGCDQTMNFIVFDQTMQPV